jgi:hypothetical protein
VGFEVLTAVVMKGSIFWDILPCNPLKIDRRFGGVKYSLLFQSRRLIQARNQQEEDSELALLATCFILASCFTYSSTLKMGAIHSNETSVDFHLNMKRHIPEDRTLYSQRCKNLIFNIN